MLNLNFNGRHRMRNRMITNAKPMIFEPTGLQIGDFDIDNLKTLLLTYPLINLKGIASAFNITVVDLIKHVNEHKEIKYILESRLNNLYSMDSTIEWFHKPTKRNSKK